jgi:hypothetical protein
MNTLSFHELWKEVSTNKPHKSFDELWNNIIHKPPYSVTDSQYFKLIWDAAIRSAVEVCNQKDEEYKDSVIIDKDIITDIATEIEQLY